MMGYDRDIFEREFKKDVINGKGWKFSSKWKLIEEGINRKIFLLWALKHKITFSSWLSFWRTIIILKYNCFYQLNWNLKTKERTLIFISFFLTKRIFNILLLFHSINYSIRRDEVEVENISHQKKRGRREYFKKSMGGKIWNWNKIVQRVEEKNQNLRFQN